MILKTVGPENWGGLVAVATTRPFCATVRNLPLYACSIMLVESDESWTPQAHPRTKRERKPMLQGQMLVEVLRMLLAVPTLRQ